jgi:hypothetical protein
MSKEPDCNLSGLRSPAGSGIEFLEYLTPRNGRPFIYTIYLDFDSSKL